MQGDLDYFINLATDPTARKYDYPAIKEDEQKRIKDINKTIKSIEKKHFAEQKFIKKSSYKVDYENELNKDQLQAVITLQNPLLIIAGAGTGKTKTLTYRVAFMMENGIKAEEILLLTFTRKAAKEMLDRVKILLPNSKRINGGTFHSFANEILRRYHKMLNLKPEFSILDGVDSVDVIDLLKKELQIEKIDGLPAPQSKITHEIISASKNFRKSISEIVLDKKPDLEPFVPYFEQIAKAYAKYNEAQNALDYDDLLAVLLENLQTNAKFKALLQEKYKYIMVDEFQDTNLTQKLIVDELADKYRNIMVVGDDAQSIYSWRGANFENILKFPQTYKDCKVVKLQQNYRSNQAILDFTNDITDNFSMGYKKRLHTDNHQNIIPYFRCLADDASEAKFITNEILKLHENGVKFKDIAILYRATWHKNELEKSFLLHQIPYTVVGGIKFIERQHVRDIIAYLRILANPYDIVAWHRVLLLLKNIGEVNASKIIKSVAQKHGVIEFSEFKAMSYYDELAKLGQILNENLAQNVPVCVKIANILDKHYANILNFSFEDAKIRLMDLDILINLAKESGKDLSEFLADFTIEPPTQMSYFQEKSGASDEENDYVTLSTVHSAKGLEWGYVFVIHLLDGLFPSVKALNNIANLEEERRLFYVATTRAKTRLVLTMPSMVYGYNGIMKHPSRFLSEIDGHKYSREWR